MAEALDDVLARSRDLGFLGPGPIAEQRAHAEAFLAAIDATGVGRALDLAARVEVRTARAEEAGREPTLRGSYDLIVTRGFGPPPVTAECAAPLLAVGGQLVVSEPPGSEGDRWPEAGLAGLGLVLDAVVAGPPSFARLRSVEPPAERYPRRVGIPAKRPLWT
jgi:16S rRNA (guanine527-N7)-methyltransferase